MSGKNSSKSNATKNKIFLTAAELFGNYGYDKVSIRQICEAAGVQKPTLYYYFKDKETLLLEMITFAKEVGEDIFKEKIGAEEDFLDKMKGILYGRKIFIEKYPQFFRFHAMIHLFAIPERVKRELLNYVQELTVKFMKILEEGQKQGYLRPDEDLEFLLMALNGSLNQITIRKIVFGDQNAMNDENLDRLFQFWKSHFFVNPSHGGEQ